MSYDEILQKITQDLELIKNHLKIVPDREITIKDFESSVKSYQEFAIDELKLEQVTINNQKSSILGFLRYSEGKITQETVKEYINSNESNAWKSNQLKALRRYIRDFLELGNWIMEFEIPKTRAKIKQLPSDQELSQFVNTLKGESQLVFLLLYNSGLRIGEILEIKIENLDFSINSIDASKVHSGKTKQSWVSFFTEQTSKYLKNYVEKKELDGIDYLFSRESRTIQSEFQRTSEYLGITISPHLLRSVFTDRCTTAKIPEKYIDAFCGRISHGIIAKHYTEYSPEKLREYYNLVESLLTM